MKEWACSINKKAGRIGFKATSEDAAERNRRIDLAKKGIITQGKM